MTRIDGLRFIRVIREIRGNSLRISTSGFAKIGGQNDDGEDTPREPQITRIDGLRFIRDIRDIREIRGNSLWI